MILKMQLFIKYYHSFFPSLVEGGLVEGREFRGRWRNFKGQKLNL
jgi:hypothetical protein